MNSKKNKKMKKPVNAGGYEDMPIAQPDKRQDKTKVALPSDANVDEARDWVNFNKK